MKKNLEILDYEDKKSQAGKRYVRFKTSDGWMSCFDNKAAEDLKKYEGKNASVEIVESGEFKNIKKCYGKAENNDDDKSEVETESYKPAVRDKGTSFYVSYAKDIFCALVNNAERANITKEEIMNLSIDLVKQAKKAFE